MNKKSSLAFIFTACLFLGLTNAVPAAATVITLQASLDGAQANAGAGTGSPGTGTAAVLFDDVTNDLSWNISWANLLGNVFVAHFHGPATPNQNAGVQVDFLGIAPGNPSIGNTTIDNAQAAQLLAGLWYVNIHTDQFPGGEIRGQVQQIPEPSLVSLLLSGLAGLLFVRRRRVGGPALETG